MRIARGARTVGYTLMGAAGAAAMVWPPQSVTTATSPNARSLVYVWAGLMVVGGVSSALGAATDRWLGEYVGLWPLILTFMVFGMTSFGSSRGPVAYAGGFCLSAVAALLVGRWRDTALIRKEADRQARTDETG